MIAANKHRFASTSWILNHLIVRETENINSLNYILKMRKVLGHLLEKAVNFTSSFSLFMRIMQKWKWLRTHSHYPLRISVGRLIIFHHLRCATQNESEKIKVCNLECIRRKKIPLLFLALNVWLLFFFFGWQRYVKLV